MKIMTMLCSNYLCYLNVKVYGCHKRGMAFVVVKDTLILYTCLCVGYNAQVNNMEKFTLILWCVRPEAVRG